MLAFNVMLLTLCASEPVARVVRPTTQGLRAAGQPVWALSLHSLSPAVGDERLQGAGALEVIRVGLWTDLINWRPTLCCFLERLAIEIRRRDTTNL